MVRIAHRLRVVSFLIAGLLCLLPQIARAQQNIGTNNNIGSTSNLGSTSNIGNTSNIGTGSSSATTQGGTGTTAASDFALDRPAISTDVNELTASMQSGFVGTSDLNTQFLGVEGSGEGANTQASRQFTTRTPGQNINQGTQRQPLYRTFGPNNMPYRSPHAIGFQVNRPPERSVNVTLQRTVRILSGRRPQFRNVQFEVSGASTVTLRGSVANERDLKMALLYVRMEPGVDRVVNELQVSSLDPIPPAPPAASASE